MVPMLFKWVSPWYYARLPSTRVQLAGCTDFVGALFLLQRRQPNRAWQRCPSHDHDDYVLLRYVYVRLLLCKYLCINMIYIYIYMCMIMI